ncbi:MAG: antibiotic biosynthesis monooxygenase [Dehalococcoidia bacterium]
MFVVLAEEWIIPGRRPELVAAHEETSATLRAQAGFRGGRLLHFAGGPYRYLYETSWDSREDWERFWSGTDFAGYRETIDRWLSAPFSLDLYDVKTEA